MPFSVHSWMMFSKPTKLCDITTIQVHTVITQQVHVMWARLLPPSFRLLEDVEAISSLGLLSVRTLYIFLYSLCVGELSFPWVKVWEVNCWAQHGCVFNIRKCQTVFPCGYTPWFSPALTDTRCSQSISLQSSEGSGVAPHGSVWLHLLKTNAVSICQCLSHIQLLLWSVYSSFLPIFYLGCLFSIKLRVFFICVYMYSRYKSFFQIQVLQIFSPCQWLAYSLLFTVSFM